MNHVIASSSLPRDILDALIYEGYTPIVMPPYSRLQAGVAAHPDMLLFFIDGICLTTREYFELAHECFDKIATLGFKIVPTDELPSSEYPNDVLFNSLLLKSGIYGYERGMSHGIKSLAYERGINIVSVRQGYTKCSALKVDENAIITADRGIYEAVKGNGGDALLISAGGIRLDGYDTGFIGGCGGYFKGKVYFCGDIFSHPDANKIIEFCKKHEKECVSLGNSTLFDAGSLFFI